MPVLAVADASIPYEIKRSPRARRLRITIRPGGVEVVAPRRTRAATIEAFVRSKARWIHEKTRALRERGMPATPARFVDGARLLFRDRPVTLRVEAVDVARTTLDFDGELYLRVPRRLADDRREEAARRLVLSWLRERARKDAQGWIDRYATTLGAAPARLRIGDQKTRWGSCSPRGTISLNWRLTAAPERVFEYVVVHELCHLKEPNHGPTFWRLVERLMPDYRARREWLKRHGVALG